MSTNYYGQVIVGADYEHIAERLIEYALDNFADKLEYFDADFDDTPEFYDVMHTIERETGIKINNFNGGFTDSSIHEDYIGIAIELEHSSVGIADVAVVTERFKDALSDAISDLRMLVRNPDAEFLLTTVACGY